MFIRFYYISIRLNCLCTCAVIGVRGKLLCIPPGRLHHSTRKTSTAKIMDEKRKAVAVLLRSVIMPFKDGLPLMSLPGHYKGLMGEFIPFKELGYSTLRDMLVDMPDVLRIQRNRSGQDLVFAIADASTEHIHSLVSRQQSTKSKPMSTVKRSRPFRPNSYRTPATSPSHWNSYLASRRTTTSRSQYKPKSYEHNPLQRIPSPTPAPSAAAMPRSRNGTYSPPPRFLRKKKREDESVSTRSDSPVTPPPVRLSTPEFGSSGTAAARSTSYEPPERGPSPAQRRTIDSNGVASNEPDYELGNPFARTVAYQPVPDPLPTRTVSFVRRPDSPPPRASPSPPPISVAPRQSSAPIIPAGRVVRGQGAVTSRELVDDFAKFHGLERPVYRSLPVKSKKLKTAFVSTLILLDTKYLSYPEEKPTAAEAEEVAASKAMKALNIVAGEFENTSIQETLAETSSQINLLVDKLYKIIKEKPNGIWHTKVPQFYEEIYRETLPKNWLALLRTYCPDLCINDTMEKDFILYPDTSSPRSIGFQKDQARRSPTTVQQPGREVHEPRPIVLPESNEWDVFVTHIFESLTIAVRLLDYCESYDYLRESMDNYYVKSQHPVQEVAVGEICAVESHEDGWFRVRIADISNGKAKCYFLDNGDFEYHDIGKVNVLVPQFLSLPYQAILCKLDGVQQFDRSSAAFQKLLDLAHGKVHVAKVVSREPVSLCLYDTSVDEPININQVIVEVRNQDLLAPHFPEVNQIKEGFLTHVTDEGDLFVQIRGTNLDVLDDLTTDIAELCEDRKGLVTSVSLTKMYCAKYQNGLWYRAYVRNISPDDPDMVTVWYVDYGNTAVIHISEICEVDSISICLSDLPYQALRCRLHRDPKDERLWTRAASAFLRRMVPLDLENPLIIKVVTRATDTSPPGVDLFRRSMPENELCLVNQVLFNDDSLFSRRPSVENNAPVVRPADVQLPAPPVRPADLPLPSRTVTFQGIPDVALSAHMFEKRMQNLQSETTTTDSSQSTLPSLLPPEIPGIGQNLDVIVTLAAHPHNFTVQPWSSSVFLDELMTEMQSFYNSEDNVCDMHECLLKEGEFYASKHKDGQWYRTCVIRRMPDQPDTVWVYFVDFGDYYLMTLNDLQPLWRRFRSLPFQAIRASLADVEPLEGDWDPMDCVHFQDMVMDKQFVSVVKSKTVDKSNSLGGCELGLTLIDTSSDKDVFVHDLLVEKGNSKLVNK